MKEMIQLLFGMTSLLLDCVRMLYTTVQDLGRKVEVLTDTMRKTRAPLDNDRAIILDAIRLHGFVATAALRGVAAR